MLADVALNAPLRAGDRAFTFAVPETLQDSVAVGVPVRVPFGRQSAAGFVVALRTQMDRPVRAIIAVDERIPPLPADLVELASWIADYYVCSIGEALWTMIPPLPAAARQSVIPEPAPGRGRGAAEQTGRGAVTAHLRRDPSARIALLADQARFRGYAEALRWLADDGRDAIFLVPEVVQAEALVRWIARHTPLPTTLLHGAMPAAQRWAVWRRVRSGEARVVVGTRLAVFAPLPRLGLIVIDHEEDASYKEERTPRYHARRVAEERAARSGAALIWGTPVPSTEVMRAVAEGRALAVAHPARAHPAIVVTNVRGEASSGGGLIGRRLYEALERTLPRGRAILFVPRRGYADFLLCQECGWVPRCPRCGVAMTYYARRVRLLCHLCGREVPAPEACENCGGTDLRPRGVGTERVERAARRLFRTTPIYRLDAAAAPKESAQQRIWQQFSRRGGLLIGTQLLLRGVGQTDAAVVGAISVDAGLHLPDFRAAERTHQVLSRLAALARREMIVQTFDPGHPVLRALADGNMDAFYRQELALRREFRYPPYHTLINLVVSSPAADDARDISGRLAASLSGGDILGPSPAPLARVRGRHRWQILIKEGEEMTARPRLAELVRTLALPRGAKVSVDVDPVELL